MKKILITGGAGFIGSNLALELERRYGNKVFVAVLDNLSSGTFRNLQGFKGDFITSNLTDMPMDCNLRYDYVFHLASISDTRNMNEQEQCYNNIEGFRSLLSRVYEANQAAKIIYASSASVYGITKDEAPLKEDLERSPQNPYAFTKVQLENLAGVLAREVQMPIYGVRFFNVYGPGEANKKGYASMIYQLAAQARDSYGVTLFEDGSQKRDFIHVKDVVEMLIRLINYNGEQYVFNCGSGAAVSFNEIVSIIDEPFKKWLCKGNKITPQEKRDVMNSSYGPVIKPAYIKCPYDFFQPYTCADMSLAEKELGFKPLHSNLDGIKNYIKSILC